MGLKEIITPLSYFEITHPEISSIRVYPSREETAQAVAQFIIDLVQNNPEAAITYATGNTMIPVYQRIAEAIKGGEVNFSQTKAFHLDEYYPCDPCESHSFVQYLNQYVFEPFQITEENRFIMNGLAADPQVEASRYNTLLKQQPIALAILGIGPGSHIAFNEQGTPFESETHLARLSQETITRDQVERGQETPEHALTQGINNILETEQILLVAYGAGKGEYLKPTLWGPIDSQVPASALRLKGEKVSLYIDNEAAQHLGNRA